MYFMVLGEGLIARTRSKRLATPSAETRSMESKMSMTTTLRACGFTPHADDHQSHCDPFNRLGGRGDEGGPCARGERKHCNIDAVTIIDIFEVNTAPSLRCTPVHYNAQLAALSSLHEENTGCTNKHAEPAPHGPAHDRCPTLPYSPRSVAKPPVCSAPWSLPLHRRRRRRLKWRRHGRVTGR